MISSDFIPMSIPSTSSGDSLEKTGFMVNNDPSFRRMRTSPSLFALIQHSGKLLPGFRISIRCHNTSSLTPIPAFNAAWSKPLLSGFHLSFGFCNLTFPTPPAATAASPSLPKRGTEGEFVPLSCNNGFKIAARLQVNP